MESGGSPIIRSRSVATLRPQAEEPPESWSREAKRDWSSYVRSLDRPAPKRAPPPPPLPVPAQVPLTSSARVSRNLLRRGFSAGRGLQPAPDAALSASAKAVDPLAVQRVDFWSDQIVAATAAEVLFLDASDMVDVLRSCDAETQRRVVRALFAPHLEDDE
jgi:hypothetical protein